MQDRESREEAAKAWLFPPVIITVISILKALTAGYSYPRQDLIIYTTFLYARLNPEQFARDVFAELRHTHFDFFWLFAPALPDVWLDGDVMKNITLVTWVLLFCSVYVCSSLFIKSMWLRFVPILFLGWSKATAGRMVLFEYSFSHRQISYALCFLGLWLLFKEKRWLAITAVSVSALLYPPLLYYFCAPLGLFMLIEFGWKKTSAYLALMTLLCSPLLYAYFRSGVVSSLLAPSAEIDWVKYFLINFDSIFSFYPVTWEKVFFIGSWLGCALIVFLLWIRRAAFSDVQRQYTRLLTVFLFYASVGMLLFYAKLELALRLQLLRAAVIAAMLTTVGIGFLLESVWGERKRLEKFCALAAFLSYHFLVVFAAVLNFLRPSKAPLRYIAAALVLFGIDQTNAVYSASPLRTNYSRWKDAADYAKQNLEHSALVMIPPVSNLDYCNTDDQVSFRLLAQRSTTLKVSDGVEIGYDVKFARQYIDYLNKLRDFLEIEFDFSSDCAFREKIKTAWNRKGVAGQLEFARQQQADFLLISNHLLPALGLNEAVFAGKNYSLLVVKAKDKDGQNVIDSGSI